MNVQTLVDRNKVEETREKSGLIDKIISKMGGLINKYPESMVVLSGLGLGILGRTSDKEYLIPTIAMMFPIISVFSEEKVDKHMFKGLALYGAGVAISYADKIYQLAERLF